MQDALRLYLINSPVVRAEPLRFKKEGVYGVVSIFSIHFLFKYFFYIFLAEVFLILLYLSQKCFEVCFFKLS